MQILTEIISKLNKAEVALLNSYYRTLAESRSSKRQELLELLLSGETDIDDEEAAKIIYGKAPDAAFSHLKERLKNDILGIILLQDPERKFSVPSRQAKFTVRKRLMEGELLLSRGISGEGIKILKKAAKLAAKFELVAEQILIEDLIRDHLGFKIGLAEFEKYSQNIEDNIFILTEILYSKHELKKLTLSNLFKANRKKGYKDIAAETLVKLRESYNRTNSPHIGYWYYKTAVSYYLAIREFKQALVFANNFLILVEEEIAIQSDSNIAGINMNIAVILLNLKRPEEAIEFAMTAVEHFKTGLINELVALEVLFYAYLRSYQYDQCAYVLKTAFKHKKIKSNKFVLAKWNFLRANYDVMTGNFDDALKELSKHTSLSKDKSGWLLGFKILEIIAIVEAGLNDWFEYRLEAFKKLLQRQKGNNIHREKLIYSILYNLVRQNYNFDITYEAKIDDFKKLIDAKGDYYWNSNSYEVIKFDEWFLSKCKKYGNSKGDEAA